MDCGHARLLLAFRASDLTADDAAALDAHLAGCPVCGVVARRQAAEDRAIATAGRSVTVPDGLKKAAHAKVAAAAAKMWRVKWLGRSTVTAAAVTLGLIGYGGYQAFMRPQLQTYPIADRLELLWTDPDRSVRDWLREKGIPEPFEYDFRLAVSHGNADLNGASVPFIDLRSGTLSARVFLIPPGRMSLRNAIPAQNSTVTVQVFRDSPAAGWTIVVAYTGQSLQPFLRPDNRG